MNNVYEKMKQLDSKKGLAGALLAAAAASVCCIGPLIVLGFGVGGAWASSFSFFEPVRPYLIVVTVGLIGYSFYRIYWKTKTVACEPGAVCATPKGAKMNKISLWTVTLLAVGLLSVPYLIPSVNAQPTNNAVTNTKTVTLDVSGMTCNSCENAFVKGTTSVQGVSNVLADYATGKAVVSFDSTQVTLDKVLSRTENIGYRSTVAGAKKVSKSENKNN